VTRAARRAIVAFLGVAFVAACGGDDGPDRRQVVDALATDTVSVVEALPQSAEAFGAAVDKNCANPSSANLDELRQALAQARAAWKRSEAYWFGPIQDRRAWAAIDWPPSEEDINELLDGAEPATIDADYIGRRVGADTRGYGAAELVLHEDELDERRCEFLAAIADVAEAEMRISADAWAKGVEGDPAYRSVFTGDEQMAVDEVVNSSLMLIEQIADRELGVALGEVRDEADLTVLPEGPGGWGTDELSARLEGLERLLVGTDEEGGLSPLLGDELQTRLRDELAKARTAADALEGSLHDNVQDNAEAVSAARAALSEVEKTLATEVVSRLGVTIGFDDNDGDSAG
jgi:predicted lipoprotein